MARGLLLFVFLLLFVAGGLVAASVLAPTRTVIVQEQLLGVLHNGIVGIEDQTFTDNCVPTDQGLRAVQRTRRIVRFADGASFEVIFSAVPVPSDAQC